MGKEGSVGSNCRRISSSFILSWVSFVPFTDGETGTVITEVEFYFILTNCTAIIPQSGSHSGQGRRMCTQLADFIGSMSIFPELQSSHSLCIRDPRQGSSYVSSSHEKSPRSANRNKHGVV